MTHTDGEIGFETFAVETILVFVRKRPQKTPRQRHQSSLLFGLWDPRLLSARLSFYWVILGFVVGCLLFAIIVTRRDNSRSPRESANATKEDVGRDSLWASCCTTGIGKKRAERRIFPSVGNGFREPSFSNVYLRETRTTRGNPWYLSGFCFVLLII